MDHQVTQDATGTHLDWRHDGVTARMIDWFWSNMEKGFVLWHPTEHEPLTWVVAPQDGDPVGSVHLAPQTWSDGTFQNLYIRFEEPGDVPGAIADTSGRRRTRRRRALVGHRRPQARDAAGRARLGEALRRGDRQLGRLTPAALRALQGGPARTAEPVRRPQR
jgi:hypothetical protein